MELVSVEIGVNTITHDTCVPITRDGRGLWAISQDMVGIGGDGTVWKIHASNNILRDEDNYVAKIIKFDKVPKNVFLRNINVQNAIAKVSNITIPVVDFWACDKFNGVILGKDISGTGEGEVGVMVMKELGENLYNFIMNNPLSLEDTIALLDNARGMMEHLHSLGFYHGDLRLENIMVDTTPSNLDMYFIDFTRGGSLNVPRRDPLTRQRVTRERLMDIDSKTIDYDRKSILRDKFNVSLR